VTRARLSHRRRRGTVLIVTIVICFALAGAIIVLARSTRVEMQASANEAAAIEASAVERGAEQYVLAMLGGYKDQLRSMSEDEFAAVPVGRGCFWLLRPDYDDPTLPVFGLMEESAKLNLTGVDYDDLIRLPGMTYTAASSILDWTDEDGNLERDGAENEYYLGLQPEPYYCKNAPLETVEELLMVRDVYRDMLYGDGTAPPLGQRYSNRDSGRALFSDPQLARGIYDLLTVYTREPNTTEDGQPRISTRRLNRSQDRANLQNRMVQRGISQSRAAQILATMGTAPPDNIFDFYFRGQLKPDEFELIKDDISYTNGQTLQQVINFNAAPPAVLRSIDGLELEDADKLVAARSGNDPTSDSIAWIADALGRDKAVAIGRRVTWRTFQYSADILAVSGNGRAFKRVRIVVDTRSGTPQIVYRRDNTDRGWPMDKEILASIRRGESMTSGASNLMPGNRSGGGSSSLGGRF
jgi:type II secretory pathway component PulK